MASAENKRLRGGKAHAARKRQKLEEESPRPSKISISSRGTPKVVALDQLAWKEVALPDRFDDAEGFFGLEEIDDVEIVRDESNRSVQYRVGKASYRRGMLLRKTLIRMLCQSMMSMSMP